MSIKRLLILAGVLALAACAVPTSSNVRDDSCPEAARDDGQLPASTLQCP